MFYNHPAWLKPAFICTGGSLARCLYRMLRGRFTSVGPNSGQFVNWDVLWL